MFARLLSLATSKIHSLPILVLMPHSRCNCRCLMCDIWKANHQKMELSDELLEKHLAQFVRLKVREVVLSGGEALMHSNLWNVCSLFKKHSIRVVLLSTGLLLEKYAKEIVQYMDEVILSLDGSQRVHDRIRNIPHGYEKLSRGIHTVKGLKSHFKVTARCVLQRRNYFDLINIVKSAKEIGVDSISFLAADVSTTAFNRPDGWNEERVSEVALTNDEIIAFESLVLKSFTELEKDYESGFINERPQKMQRIIDHYKAINGQIKYSSPICNAPWVSAVIESDGSVLPCFFHKPYGNINENDFLTIINSAGAVQFRKSLRVKDDPICQKCVCSLKLGLRQLN